MTVSSSPTGSPVPGAHFTENTSRLLTDSLLDDDEQIALTDALAIECEREYDPLDTVKGWGYCVSFPRPPASPPKRLGFRRRNKPVPPDIDISNIKVRCVGEDYSNDHQRAAWKANVEPGTYRYISNNGIYRSTKFASTGTEWVTAKRSKHTEKLTSKPEVLQAQKTLKRDLDQHFKTPDKERAQNIIHGNPRPVPRPEPEEKNPPPPPPPPPPPAPAMLQPERCQPPQERYKNPQLVKSASDLFVENFSSRMVALEKVEKENAGSNGANPQSAAAILTTSQLRRSQDGGGLDATKFQAQMAEDIAKDVFTVKPVTRSEQLRPLEKLTPQQKQMDRASDSERSSVPTNSNPESPALSASFITAMNAFAQLHHQHYRGDKNPMKSSSSALRQQHRSGFGRNFSSNASDTDSLSSVRNALNLTNIDIEKMRMNHLTARDYNRFLTGKNRNSTTKLSTIGKSVGVQRKGVVGYKPFINPHAISPAPATSGTNTTTAFVNKSTPASDDVCSVSSDVTSESFLSGASLAVNKGGIKDTKSSSMSLPEISGKRLAVAATSHRLL